MDKGLVCKEGMDSKPLEHFDLVLSGHFHTKSHNGHIHYLGAQMEFFWNDAHDPKYFHVFDTETCELLPVQNPLTIYHKIYYNEDEINYFEDMSYLDNKFVKVIVTNRSDVKKFERYIERIQSQKIHELKIAEDFREFRGENVDGVDINVDDTQTLVYNYIDEVDTDLDKDRIKGFVSELMVEAQSVNVFIEAAFFDPVRTAYTGRALKIHSDARYRFERGIDPVWTPIGLDHATQMILDLCGGAASDVVVAGAIPDHSRAYRLDTDRVQSLVGMEISADEQRKTLTALGFELDRDMAHVPSWRPDVLGEADLVEEVARVASLTKLQGKPLPRITTGVPKAILTPMQKREQTARRTMAALGYNECVTYSFIDRKSAELFGGGDDATMLENPISSDMSHMRPDLLAGLLQAAQRNQARGFSDMALFEVGPAFHGGEPEEQNLQVAGLLVGRTGPKDVHGASRSVDLFDAKADVEAVLAALGAPAKVQILRDGASWWHPGRHGRICLGPKKMLAVFGEVHPKTLAEMDVKGPAVAFTIWPAEIPMPRNASATRPALHLNDLQAVERDFAFVVDANVEALTLVNAAAGADKALIENVHVFDEFIGGSLGDGKKSLAITVRLQPTDGTLTEKDIEAASAKVVEKVVKATGGELRG